MGTKKKGSKKSKKSGGVLAKGKAVASKFLGGKSKGSGRSRKKSALWYAKEIARLKMKKKYQNVKMKVI